MADLLNKPEPFRRGQSELSASALNMLRNGMLRQVRGNGNSNVSYYGDRVTVGSNAAIPFLSDISNYIAQFVVIDEDYDTLTVAPFTQPVDDDDLWTPQTYDEDLGQDSLVTLKVAKPWALQREPWDGKTVEVNGESTIYNYGTVGERVASVGLVNFDESITPSYYLGDIIHCVRLPSGLYDDISEDVPIAWMDMNTTGRTWKRETVVVLPSAIGAIVDSDQVYWEPVGFNIGTDLIYVNANDPLADGGIIHSLQVDYEVSWTGKRLSVTVKNGMLVFKHNSPTGLFNRRFFLPRGQDVHIGNYAGWVINFIYEYTGIGEGFWRMQSFSWPRLGAHTTNNDTGDSSYSVEDYLKFEGELRIDQASGLKFEDDSSGPFDRYSKLSAQNVSATHAGVVNLVNQNLGAGYKSVEVLVLTPDTATYNPTTGPSADMTSVQLFADGSARGWVAATNVAASTIEGYYHGFSAQAYKITPLTPTHPSSWTNSIIIRGYNSGGISYIQILDELTGHAIAQFYDSPSGFPISGTHTDARFTCSNIRAGHYYVDVIGLGAVIGATGTLNGAAVNSGIITSLTNALSPNAGTLP